MYYGTFRLNNNVADNHAKTGVVIVVYTYYYIYILTVLEAGRGDLHFEVL